MIIHNGIRIVSTLETWCIHKQWLDGTSRLTVTLVSTIERIRCKVLIAATDDRNDISCAVVDRHSGTLHIIGSVIIQIGIRSKFIIHSLLQCILLVHINRGINLIAARIQLLLTGSIQLVIFLVVRLLLLLRIKIILEGKTLLLHQCTCCAIISVSIHEIVHDTVLRLLRPVQCDFFLAGLIILLLRDFAIVPHIL